MTIFRYGISHDEATVSLRERVAFSGSQITEALASLAEIPELLEVALLSTCNRTELYAVSESADVAHESLTRFLARHRGLEERFVAAQFHGLADRDAVIHLLRVAAGLESQILGEGQILGQVREAAATARTAGTLGPVLDALFRQAITTGKRVRTETPISQGAVSVGAAAVELARRELDTLADRTVLVLGAGKIGEATIKHLVGQGVRKLLVSNRTLELAQSLARDISCEAVPFHAIASALGEADVVLCCTAAPHYILADSDLGPVMTARAGRPLVMVDISVPRNIDPRIGGHAGVTLFDIDALSSLADQARTERSKQAPAAEAIVADEAENFEGWQRSYQAAPTIASLRHKLDVIRQGELDRFLARHGEGLTLEQQEAVGRLTLAITNKFLHEPTVGLKAQTGAKREAHALAIRDLFQLQVPVRPAGGAPASAST